jgi:hypothetical protein
MDRALCMKPTCLLMACSYGHSLCNITIKCELSRYCLSVGIVYLVSAIRVFGPFYIWFRPLWYSVRFMHYSVVTSFLRCLVMPCNVFHIV